MKSSAKKREITWNFRAFYCVRCASQAFLYCRMLFQPFSVICEAQTRTIRVARNVNLPEENTTYRLAASALFQGGQEYNVSFSDVSALSGRHRRHQLHNWGPHGRTPCPPAIDRVQPLNFRPFCAMIHERFRSPSAIAEFLFLSSLFTAPAGQGDFECPYPSTLATAGRPRSASKNKARSQKNVGYSGEELGWGLLPSCSCTIPQAENWRR